MYSKSFYITEAVGNNALSFERRNKPQLFVPSLKQIASFDEIELLQPLSFCKGKNSRKDSSYEESSGVITFEDYDFDDALQTCYGLKNLYEMQWKGKPLYLVDNHNHVFYFWYLARNQGIITDNALLYHIDEHADTRDPGGYLMKPESEDLEKVFEYTNFTLNVGNYIIPAQKEGLIGEVIQIRGEEALSLFSPKGREATASMYKNDLSPLGGKYPKGDRGIILNLDLDFFEPELDFIDYNLKKQVILDIAEKADLITVCTSPFFIDQERALEVFKDIFD